MRVLFEVRAMLTSCTSRAGMLVAVVIPLALAVSPPTRLPPLPLADLSGLEPLRVERVFDCRTIGLLDGERAITVRLLGVAPPRAEAQRDRARDFLSQALIGESVFVVEDGAGGAEPAPAGQPPPRRALLYRSPDGMLINLELVRQGYAPVAAWPEFDLSETFRAYEDAARHAARGIWRKPDPAPAAPEPAVRPAGPAPPGERPAADAEGTVYVTRSGKKYHRAECQHVRQGGQAIALKDARGKYGPCSVCKPPE